MEIAVCNTWFSRSDISRVDMHLRIGETQKRRNQYGQNAEPRMRTICPHFADFNFRKIYFGTWLRAFALSDLRQKPPPCLLL